MKNSIVKYHLNFPVDGADCDCTAGKYIILCFLFTEFSWLMYRQDDRLLRELLVWTDEFKLFTYEWQMLTVTINSLETYICETRSNTVLYIPW